MPVQSLSQTFVLTLVAAGFAAVGCASTSDRRVMEMDAAATPANGSAGGTSGQGGVKVVPVPGIGDGSGGMPGSGGVGTPPRIDAATGFGTGGTPIAPGTPVDAAGNPRGGGDAALIAAGKLILYVEEGAKIQAFSVDRNTGELAKKGAPVDACKDPIHLLTDRAQKFLYGACPGDKGLLVLSIDKASGDLAKTGFAGGGVAAGVGVHPSAGFALTADYDGGTTLFKIAADGKPEKVQAAAAAVNTHGARFDGLGKYAYVTNAGSNSINQFSFDGAKLSALTPPTVTFVTDEPVQGGKKEPRYLIDSPDGKFIYVIGQRPPSIFAFKVGPDGGLTKVGSGVSGLEGPLATDVNGKDVIMAPSGDTIYATINSMSKIAVFSVDGQTGKVALKKTIESGGMLPSQMAIDPAGQFLFVAHEGSREVVGFRVDAGTGLLTMLPAKTKMAGASQSIAAINLKN